MRTECQPETPTEAQAPGGAETPLNPQRRSQVDEPVTGRRAGVRAGLPFALATFTLGISFGVLAEPVMGAVAPIVMSIVVFAGAAQFAALSALAAGAGAPAAIVSGLLLNTRFLPMGFAVGPSLRGRRLRRAAQGQAVVDASFALASRGDGSFDRGLLMWSTAPQALAWISGTILGVLGGAAIADPERYGLDAIFPAFYLALLAEEVGSRKAARRPCSARRSRSR